MRYLSLWRVRGGSIEPFMLISLPHKFIPNSIFPPSSIHPSLLLSSSPSSCVKGVVHYELKLISLIIFVYSCRYNLGKGTVYLSLWRVERGGVKCSGVQTLPTQMLLSICVTKLVAISSHPTCPNTPTITLASTDSCSCLYCTRLSQNPYFLHHPSTHPCYCPSLYPS